MDIFERTSEIQLLSREFKKFLQAQSNYYGLVGISGFGGIGKTYLLDYVLDELARTEELTKATIQIRVDGNKEYSKNFAELINNKVAPGNLSPFGKSKFDYFDQTRRLLECQKVLTDRVEKEIDTSTGSEELKHAAKLLYRLAPYIAMLPHAAAKAVAGLLASMEAINVDKHLDEALKLIKELQALSAKRGWLDFSYKKRVEALQENPSMAFANSYILDVRNIFGKLEWSDKLFKPLAPRIDGAERFLLILDDFEITGASLASWLVEDLLKALKSIRTPVLVVILCRDDLEDFDGRFGQKQAAHVTQQIRLEPFAKESAIKYLTQAGYSQENAEKGYEDSKGFPFLLRYMAQNPTPSAVALKRFYRRVTLWMTTNQIEWFEKICYLESVSEPSIKRMLPDEDEKTVWQWFTSEGSIRDTQSEVFRIAPYIEPVRKPQAVVFMGVDAHKKWGMGAENAPHAQNRVVIIWCEQKHNTDFQSP